MIIIIFGRVCAPPHAAVRGRVPAVCLPLDEQPPDEGAATTLHNQTVGHIPGTKTHTHTAKLLLLCFLLSVHFCLALHEILETGVADNDISDCLRSGAFVIPAIISQPTQWYDATY